MNIRKLVPLNVRVILALLTISALSFAPVANAATVIISGSMEGNLPINPGDTVRAGYEFTLPGYQGDATTVTVSNASVVVHVTCPNNSTQSILIPLPNQTYALPAKAKGWFPPGGQKSPATYQGSVTAGTCPGGHAPVGATFTANFTSPASCITVNTQFHYSDSNDAKSDGGWSATVSVDDKKQCLSAPCDCKNKDKD